MKKINYEDLGNYFKELAEKEFGVWFDDKINSYVEYFCPEEVYDEKDDLYKCHIELTHSNKKPLVIEFYKKYTYDENDNIIDEEYYI